jgi:hypothetical protein
MQLARGPGKDKGCAHVDRRDVNSTAFLAQSQARNGCGKTGGSASLRLGNATGPWFSWALVCADRIGLARSVWVTPLETPLRGTSEPTHFVVQLVSNGTVWVNPWI